MLVSIPLSHTPEAQVISLMEAAPVEVTPKVVSFKTPEVASKAMAPVMSILDAERESKTAQQMFKVISASIAANTQKQLAAFGDQISTLLAPITNRLAATHPGRNHPNPTTPSTWGRTDDDDFEMDYTAANAPMGGFDNDEDMPPPHSSKTYTARSTNFPCPPQ